MQKYQFEWKVKDFIKHENLLLHIKMDKEIIALVIMKLKNINFTTIKVIFFRGWRRNVCMIMYDNILVSSKISFCEKNCKYFVSYLYNGHEIKPLNVMLPKNNLVCKKLWWSN